MSAKRIRILFDAHALLGQKTGVGYYTGSLISALAKAHRDDVELVGYYHNFLYRKTIIDLPVASNIRYRRIAFIPGQVVNLLRRFHIPVPIELLTLTKADFILYPNFLGLPSLFKTPSATVIHDLTFVDLPNYVAQKNLHDLQQFIPSQIKRSSFIITVSEFGKKRLHKVFNIPNEDILVTLIPPETPMALTPEIEQRTLKKLGINTKYILTLGTIEPRKNLLNMLDAYLKLPEKVQKEYAFVSAGKIGWNCDEEVARLAQLQADGKNIIRVGYVTEEERSVLYHSATLFTWASHYEGFGMPILEAMSYGTPCAVSNIAVFKEVAGDTALYFNQDDPLDIAKSWEYLIENTEARTKLAAAGKRREQQYEWGTVAEELFNKITRTITPH